MAGMSSVAASVGAFVPVQRLQAERAAAQAEGRAQRLAAESQQARSQADVLLQRADRLREASGQAQNEAVNARRAGDASPAVAEVGQALDASLPAALRETSPLPSFPPNSSRTALSGPASVPENVAFINRYLQAGSPAPGAAATATGSPPGRLLDVRV